MDIFNYFKEGKNSYGEKSLVPNTNKIVKHIIIAIIIIFFIIPAIFGSFGTISAGNVGVKTTLGKVSGTAQPGLYFKAPFFQQMHSMSVKTLTINYDKGGDVGNEKNQDTNLFGASKDLQDVAIGVVVNYHIDASKVSDIYTQYSSVENYQANVIEPIIRELVKSTSAQYTAEELVTKRAEFSDKVNALLATQFIDKSAILERFSVTNFQFSDAFSKAIESKVTAVQNAEAQKNKLEQVKYEAQQQIETARAQAETIRIQANAINSQGGADYVQLKAIEKWNGNLPVQMVPNATVPFIDLNK